MQELKLDVAVIGASVLLPGGDIVRADIGVSGETIAAVVAPGILSATRAIDATGLLVAPGIVEPHGHYGAHVSMEQDLEYETRSALLGGVTTIGCFVHTPGSYFDAFKTLVERARPSVADYFFHFIVSTEQHLEELPAYAERFGIRSFKAYLATGVFGMVDDDYLLRLFQRARAIDEDVIVCVHAENDALVRAGTARGLAETGAGGTLADWSRARPDYAQEEGLIRAAYLAELAGTRMYAVHLTTRREVERAQSIKARFPLLAAETCTHYLSLTTDHPMGTLVKRNPPLREATDVDALWKGVRDGTIDVIGTDMVVGSTTINDPSVGVFKAKLGFTILGTHLAVALDEGHHRRGIPVARILDTMTAGPARLFGLYPRKGAIAVGSDADLVGIDLSLERRVDHRELHTWSDFSPWDGEVLRGWPVLTLRRGRVVAQDGRLVEPLDDGRFLARGAAQPRGSAAASPA